MLTGKEVEGKIGQDGEYFVDVHNDGTFRMEAKGGANGVKAGAFIEGDIIALLKMLAAKTETSLDDKAVEFIEKMLPGRKQPEAPVEG